MKEDITKKDITNYIRNRNYQRNITFMFHNLLPEEDYLKEIKKQIKNEQNKN